MPYGGEMNLLGGLLQGYVQGQMMNKRQAMMEQQALEAAETGKIKREELKLQQQMQKIKMMEMEQQAARQERLAPLTDLLVDHFAQSMQSQLGAQQAPTTTPSGAQLGASITGETAQPQGVADMAAMMQMLNHPMIAKMAEDAGIPGASRMPQHLIDQQKLALQQAQYNRGFTEGQIRDVPVPGVPGATMPMRFPKYGGGDPQPIAGVGMTPPKLDSMTIERGGEKFSQPVNPYSGQPTGPATRTGDVKGESAEASAKIALANQGIDNAKSFQSMIIGQDGKVNRELILKMNAPLGGVGAGRNARALFLDALDARARAATGASMPESEVRNYERMYFPSPLDNDETIKNKMNRLDGFLKDYMKTLDPSGNMRNRLNQPGTGKTIRMKYNPATGKLE